MVTKKRKKHAPPTVNAKIIPPSESLRFLYSLFDEVPAYSLVFLRVAWGLVMLVEVNRFIELEYSLAKSLLVDPLYMYKYPLFEWIPRASLETWKSLLQVMRLCCILFSIGCFYHLAAFTFFVLFSFMFLQDATMYLNHYYLISILCGLFCCLPANRTFAIDPYLRLSKHSTTVPYWSVWICRALISIVYWHAGIAKLNEDWIRGEPLLHWVPRRCRLYPNLCWLLKNDYTSIVMSWCGLVFDLLCPFMFMRGGMLRKLGFVASTFFHVTNMMIFNIGIFPIVMLVTSMIYCDFDWPLACMRVLFGKKSNTKVKASPTPTAIPRDTYSPFTKREKLTIILLCLFTTIQALIPIRHVFYPGNVVWNELGHNFSWRMKLRDKVGIAKFYVTPSYNMPSTENSRVVGIHKFLSESQIKRMAGRPQLMFQTVDEIIRRYKFAFKEIPKVNIISIASVNYRPDQFLLDPTIDFASVESRQEYILPFVPRHCNASCPNVVEELQQHSEIEFIPKERLMKQYDHVDLTQAMEYFETSKERAMPESSRGIGVEFTSPMNVVWDGSRLIRALLGMVLIVGSGIMHWRQQRQEHVVVVVDASENNGAESKKKR